MILTISNFPSHFFVVDKNTLDENVKILSKYSLEVFVMTVLYLNKVDITWTSFFVLFVAKWNAVGKEAMEVQNITWKEWRIWKNNACRRESEKERWLKFNSHKYILRKK